MTNLMNEMIKDAIASMDGNCYGFAHRDVEAGQLLVRVLIVNCNSKHNQLTKRWTLDGKTISAAKVSAL